MSARPSSRRGSPSCEAAPGGCALRRRQGLGALGVLAASALGLGAGLRQLDHLGAGPHLAPAALPLPRDPLGHLARYPLCKPDGTPLSIQAWRGQPLVLNFWAAWCPPCLQELPDLDHFAHDPATLGTCRVVALALDEADNVRHFLAQHPVRLPLAVAGAQALPLLAELGNPGGGLPYTVLLGADGRLLQRHTGAIPPEHLRRWRQQLQAR